MVAITYVPPLPMLGYNQADVIKDIIPFLQAAKRKKKILAYKPVKDVTIILLHDKNLAIVKWLPRFNDFIMFGSEALDIKTTNFFGRNTFGSFTPNSSNPNATIFIFSGDTEFDIHNVEITGSLDFNYHVNQFSEMFELAVNSSYSEHPYCMPFVRSSSLISTVIDYPEPEKSYLNILNTAQKSLVITGIYNEPSSNIVYVNSWMKLHLRSLFNTIRGYTNFGFPSDHPDGAQTFSPKSRIFGINAIYKKDIVHFKNSTDFFTFSLTSFLDDFAKHVNKDPTGGAGDTFVGSVTNGQVIPFTFPGTDTTTGTVFVSGDTESITTISISNGDYRFDSIIGSVTGGFNTETEKFDVNVSYGVYLFKFNLLLGNTFLFHSTVGYDLDDQSISAADADFPPPDTGQVILGAQYHITNAGGVGQSRAVDATIIKVGGGAFQSFSFITTQIGFIFNHSELTATGVKTFGTAPPESRQVGSNVNNTLVIRFQDPPNTFVDDRNINILRSHHFGNVVLWDTDQFDNNSGVDTLSHSHPIPVTNEDNHLLDVQYSMDGRTIFRADLAGNIQRTHIAEGIISDPFLMSWVSPPGVLIGTFDTAQDNDIGNDYSPHGTGRHVIQTNGTSIFSPNGAGWQSNTVHNNTTYGGVNGRYRLTQAFRIGNDGTGQQHTTGVIDNTAFGGLVAAPPASSGSFQIDVYLVDNDLKRTGIFSMLVDPSIGDPSSLLAAFLINQHDIISEARALADPDFKKYVKGGSIGSFIPALDEDGDYLYEPPQSYLDLLTETLAFRIQLDALLAQVVIRNDFMSYELLHIWFNYVSVNRPLSSYIMHNNTLGIPSVIF